jgi:hypothetical protein
MPHIGATTEHEFRDLESVTLSGALIEIDNEHWLIVKSESARNEEHVKALDFT